MPLEIADSDDESEVIVEAPNLHPINPEETRREETVHHVDQTQRLSELTSSVIKGTGSTAGVIRRAQIATDDGPSDLELPSPNMDSSVRKRAISETQSTHIQNMEGPKNKRNKTYGSKTRDSNIDLFADPAPSMRFEDSSSNETPGDTSSASLEYSANREQVGRERDRPRRVISLLQSNAPSHQISTSVSSVGGYQSINLDFRGDQSGLADENPFLDDGTQLSVAEAQSQVQHQRSNDASQDRILFGLIDDLAQPNVRSQMMTSPLRHDTPVAPPVEPLSDCDAVGASMGANDIQHGSQDEIVKPNKRRKTEQTPIRSVSPVLASSVRRAASVSAEVTSEAKPVATKKRGRPAKANKAAEAGTDQSATTVTPLPTTEHDDRYSRAGTVESQTSHASQSASNTKRKRKRSKLEPANEELKKHPSSELHLDDEQYIGLPKEHYKPRPSRSRSKRTDDDESMPPPMTTPARGSEANIDDQDTSASKLSSAKAKKTKVKRAKTSAAGLLGRPPPMFDEGDNEVLWLESKPAAVKIDLPADLSLLKKEALEEDNESIDELQDDIGPVKRPLFSVEVPLHADGQSDGSSEKKTPKKRGRKSKKAAAAEKAAAEKTQAAVNAEEAQRLPLAEKDINVQLTKNPKTATAAKAKAKSKPIITDSDDDDDDEQENDNVNTTTTSNPTGDESIFPPKQPNPTPASTPTKPAPQVSTPSPTTTTTTQKPTHSPLKTTLTSSAQRTNRYRVGLSKRNKIPSLLRKVQRDKPPPTKTGVKIKELKVAGFNDGKGNEDGDGDGEDGGKWNGVLRDKDGRLVEWDF